MVIGPSQYHYRCDWLTAMASHPDRSAARGTFGNLLPPCLGIQAIPVRTDKPKWALLLLSPTLRGQEPQVVEYAKRPTRCVAFYTERLLFGFADAPPRIIRESLPDGVDATIEINNVGSTWSYYDPVWVISSSSCPSIALKWVWADTYAQ
jgi:hypothetical protein